MESERKTALKESLKLLIGSLMFLVGGAAALWCIADIALVERPQEDARREHWSRVPARLETCYVRSSQTRGQHGGSGKVVQATYSYEVGGKRFTSKDLGTYSFADEQLLRSCSSYTYNGAASRTPEGLTCFVNPENIAESKLFLTPSKVPMWVYPPLALAALALAGVGSYGALRCLADMLLLLVGRGRRS